MTVAITRRELGAVTCGGRRGRCRDAKAARRMLALALVLEGARARRRRGRPAWTGRPCATGCTATTRKAGPVCTTGAHAGPRPRLTPEQEAELETALDRGPDPDARRGGALAAGRPAGR